MRLVTLDLGGVFTAAVSLGEDYLNFVAARQVIPEARCIPSSNRSILEAGDAALNSIKSIRSRVLETDSLRRRLADAGAIVPADSARLAAPIPHPGAILSCGANYRSHIEEMGAKLPETPVAFLKSVNTVIGPSAAIRLPALHGEMVDWEAEFSAVIGRPCHNVDAESALDYIAGYTMIVDVSARDWVKPFHTLTALDAIQAWEENLLGKQYPTFCPMGPALVTKDEVSDPCNVRFGLSVNGIEKQNACTDDWIFTIAHLISYYSRWHLLNPGDIVTTGSPPGVGIGRNPREFLKVGDIVTVTADGVGSMSIPVVGPEI